MKMITCVAWKANKVLDGSRLLVLIKNHRQLNCGAVVLYWPVIASETGDEQWGVESGLTLPLTSFLSRCNEVSLEEDSLSCTLICKTHWDKMSLELILHAPESQAMHLRFFCTLRLFCPYLHLMKWATFEMYLSRIMNFWIDDPDL